MGVSDSQKAYIAPQAKTIDLKIQVVLCQSPGVGAASIDSYTEENLDW